MKRIGIITKRSDLQALAATWTLAFWLRNQDVEVTVTRETALAADLPDNLVHIEEQDSLPANQDLVVVVGGDGTFIAAARAVGARDIPLFGINMGRLGFLTETPVEEMLPAMREVLAGHTILEERLMLTATVEREGKEVLSRNVLNDVVVHKGELARMIEMDVSISGQFVCSVRGDGLIVATPTGSTAYALSVGGPIIHPTLDAILLAPISPHTLSNRPITVPSTGEVTVALCQEDSKRLLTLDGQTGFALANGDVIRIQKADRRLKVLHLHNRNYYDTLRNKLNWGERVGEGSLMGRSSLAG